MNKKTTDIVAYLTWVGLVVAFVIGDRKNSKFHLNQALVIWLLGAVAGIASKLLGWIPLVGVLVNIVTGLIGLFCLVCCFIGVVAAIQGQEKAVPVLGQFKLLH